jgi:hypothetical protein
MLTAPQYGQDRTYLCKQHHSQYNMLCNMPCYTKNISLILCTSCITGQSDFLPVKLTAQQWMFCNIYDYVYGSFDPFVFCFKAHRQIPLLPVNCFLTVGFEALTVNKCTRIFLGNQSHKSWIKNKHLFMKVVINSDYEDRTGISNVGF